MLKRFAPIAAIILALAFFSAAHAGTMGEIDVQPLPIGGFKPPQYINAQVLAAGVAETHTFGSGCAYAMFSANSDFYARWDGTAATVAAADITDGTGSELNPRVRYVTGQSTVSLIAPSATIVTIACYKWTR
jgi:hypothetical protein